jgi:hypothetical protein
VEYNVRQDWKAAFEAVIPPRKFVEKKRKRPKGGAVDEGNGNMDEMLDETGSAQPLDGAAEEMEEEEALNA